MGTKILITDAIDIETFRQRIGDGFELEYCPGISYEEIKERVSGFEALIVKPRVRVDRGLLSGCGLKFIGVMGSGTDNIDLEAAKEQGIGIVNFPEESVESVAEYVVGMIINLARGIVRAHASLKGVKWEKDRFCGVMLKGRVLGVMGTGKIGMEVAARAEALGMEVVGYDPYVSPGGMNMVKDLGEFLGKCDFLSVHIPLLESTENLVGKGEIEKMRNGVFIVNSSRARLFQKEALIEGLRSGKIGGYATDVHYDEPVGEEDRELLGLENVICTPHIGAQTKEAQGSLAEKMASLLVEKFGE